MISLGICRGPGALGHYPLYDQLFSRSSDKVCRYGGEKFVIRFTAESSEELLTAAKHLRNAVLPYKSRRSA